MMRGDALALQSRILIFEGDIFNEVFSLSAQFSTLSSPYYPYYVSIKQGKELLYNLRRERDLLPDPAVIIALSGENNKSETGNRSLASPPSCHPPSLLSEPTPNSFVSANLCHNTFV